MADAQELRRMYDQIDEFGTLFADDIIAIGQMFKKIAHRAIAATFDRQHHDA